MVGRTALALTALLALMVSCSNQPGTPARPSDRAATPQAEVTGVSLSFTQLRLDEGTAKAQLRVINDSDEDLLVTGAGLDWPGFGDFLLDYETEIVAGRTLDLRFDLPQANCEAISGPMRHPVVGRLRFATATHDEAELSKTLDESGTGFVTRIWQRFCNDRRVTAGVSLGYGDTWRLEGSGRRASLVGELTLTRGVELGRIDLVELRGSVLLELSLPQPAVLVAGEETITVPLVMVVPRCDEHALAESSHTFNFLAEISFGDEDPIPALRIPPEPTKAAGQRLLQVACSG